MLLNDKDPNPDPYPDGVIGMVADQVQDPYPTFKKDWIRIRLFKTTEVGPDLNIKRKPGSSPIRI